MKAGESKLEILNKFYFLGWVIFGRRWWVIFQRRLTLGDKERRDILEVLEDRHGISSTIVASQIPTEKWHDTIGDPTIADAVLDRLIHNAHLIAMKGESMRKLLSKNK
jgi:hypothetical protein